MVRDIRLGDEGKSRFLKRRAVNDTDYVFSLHSCTAVNEKINERSYAPILSVLSC